MSLEQGKKGSSSKLRGGPPPWKNSHAKKRLQELMIDPSSWIQILTEEQIHESDPLFRQYPLKNFKTNFRNLKQSIAVEQAAIKLDKRAHTSDVEKFPRNNTTERGYKFWDGHAAQLLLAEDVKQGRTMNQKPSVLQESREEYKEFPLSVFRGHKYQEERKLREQVYWQKKRNREGRSKHEREVQEQQERNG
jgi:hypothetical protein